MHSDPTELSTRARILSAAVVRFAADGITGATVRAIAAEAGVSPGLVVHHFGSKDGLRAACDAHVRTVIREGKQKALAQGASIDPLEALRLSEPDLPVMAYLASALMAGGPRADALFDDMVADARGYVQQAIDDGLMQPTGDLHTTVVVLTTWQLGALVLHDHVRRQLGADLTGGLAEAGVWMVAAGRILANGVMSERGKAMLQAVEAAVGDPSGAAQNDEEEE